MSVTLIRHDTSAYNVLAAEKAKSQLYQDFLLAFEKDFSAKATKKLALEVKEKFSLKVGDAKTPLADEEGPQAFQTGIALNEEEDPDVIFVSPYERAVLTFDHIARGWTALKKIRPLKEERIREQGHGLALLYSDWRVFFVLHPEQKALYELEGPYWYRWPQGENVPDVRDRNRSWLTTLTRDFAGKRILVVTHHLNILAMRANLERFNAEEFIALDKTDKPINCGVTVYRGYPNKGKNGRLVLESYNVKHYQ
jgi:broad specificity phosphatase PhoE